MKRQLRNHCPRFENAGGNAPVVPPLSGVPAPVSTTPSQQAVKYTPDCLSGDVKQVKCDINFCSAERHACIVRNMIGMSADESQNNHIGSFNSQWNYSTLFRLMRLPQKAVKPLIITKLNRYYSNLNTTLKKFWFFTIMTYYPPDKDFQDHAIIPVSQLANICTLRFWEGVLWCVA